MAEPLEPKRKSIANIANYLKLDPSDLIRYIDSKELKFDSYVKVKTRSFRNCVISDSLFENIVQVFAFRKKETEDIHDLKQYMNQFNKTYKKTRDVGADQTRQSIKNAVESNFFRSDEAKRFINTNECEDEILDVFCIDSDLAEINEKYKDWYYKQRMKKQNKIRKRLRGTDIDVVVDKMMRPLFYRGEKGNWISHESARAAMREQRIDDESEKNDEPKSKEEVFQPDEDLPF